MNELLCLSGIALLISMSYLMYRSLQPLSLQSTTMTGHCDCGLCRRVVIASSGWHRAERLHAICHIPQRVLYDGRKQ